MTTRKYRHLADGERMTTETERLMFEAAEWIDSHRVRSSGKGEGHCGACVRRTYLQHEPEQHDSDCALMLVRRLLTVIYANPPSGKVGQVALTEEAVTDGLSKPADPRVLLTITEDDMLRGDALPSGFSEDREWWVERAYKLRDEIDAQLREAPPAAERLEKAADMLVREVRGALGIAFNELSHVLGVTNLRALEYWADEVESALPAAKGR